MNLSSRHICIELARLLYVGSLKCRRRLDSKTLYSGRHRVPAPGHGQELSAFMSRACRRHTSVSLVRDGSLGLRGRCPNRIRYARTCARRNGLRHPLAQSSTSRHRSNAKRFCEGKAQTLTKYHTVADDEFKSGDSSANPSTPGRGDGLNGRVFKTEYQANCYFSCFSINGVRMDAH